MRYKLYGWKRVDFTTQDGKNIKGYTFYFGEQITSDGSGAIVWRLFASPEKLAIAPEQMVVGNDYFVYFNRFGKIEQIQVA